MWALFIGFGAIALLLVYVNRWYRKPMINQLTSKRVFITGTDSGFGRELALHLDKLGVKVYAGCFTKDGAENLKKTASDRLKIINIDISKVESVNRAKETIEEDLKPNQELWGLVNNAGLCPPGFSFPLSTPEHYKLAMEVNFFGTMNVTNAFWPLIKTSAGRIVNVISVAGRCSVGMEPYTCAKHAMEPYTDGLRRWMKHFGSHVAIIEPGVFTVTNMLQTALTDLSNLKSIKPSGLPSVEQTCGKGVLEAAVEDFHDFLFNPPLTRWNHPGMVTEAISHALFAKHPKARYMCGIDGNLIYRIVPFLPDWLSDFGSAICFPKLNRVLKKARKI